MKVIQGDLFELKNDFDFIAHGCNCFCTQDAGIAKVMNEKFNTSDFQMEQNTFSGDINKLGTIDFESKYIHILTNQLINEVSYSKSMIRYLYKKIIVCNAYTQFYSGANFNKVAFYLVCEKIAYLAKQHKLKVGLPLIGGGIAGGDVIEIITIMGNKFKNNDLTVVLDEKKYNEYTKRSIS